MALLRAVVVGAGGRSEDAVLPALAALKDEITVEALVDFSDERLKIMGDRYGIPGRYRSLEAFKASAHACNVGFVVTPQFAHKDPFVELVEMGMHVHCEKPVAESLTDAEAMAAAAAATEKVTMIGFDRRFSVIMQTLKELDDRVAPVVFAHVSKSKPGPPTARRVVVENAIHAIDMLHYLIPNRWTQVVGAGSSFDAQGMCEEKIAAVIEFDNGAMGSFHQVRRGGGWIERIEAYGDGWSAVADLPSEMTLHSPRYTPTAVANGTLVPVPGHPNRYRLHETEPIALAATRAFVRAIQSGGPSPLSVADALQTQELADAILRSAGLPSLRT